MSEPTTTTGKIALVTGITGQDGSYLTELLLEKGYTVRFRKNKIQIASALFMLLFFLSK
jgi:GDPmannose 4,6-dehydratase